MLKSILRTALRNIMRNRTFSALNFVGLSVAMSLSLLVIIIIRESFTYDNFHKDSDRIYRINTRAIRVEGGSEPYASSPYTLGAAISDEYSFAESVVRINRSLRGDALFGNVNVPVHGLFVDPSFLKVFNFELEKGSLESVLNEPNGLVLTHETAERIFGNTEPMGHVVSLGKLGEFQVSGVLKKITGKTHFDFEVLGSTAALALLEKQGVISPTTDNWNNYWSSYVYFKIREGGSTQEAEKALVQIASKNYEGLKLETRTKAFEFYLQPLNAITPGPELSNQLGDGMPTMVLVFLGVLVVVVMTMACVNFTNLTIAKSLSRAREIGIRKAIGAQRLQVFTQFTGESVIFSLLALIVSYFLMQALKPGFMQLNIASEFAVDLKEDYTIYILFIVFAIIVGLVAGLMPAAYLSAFKPIQVLKDTGSTLRLSSKAALRKSLIVVQFTLSVIFIIVVLVIYNQVDYMMKKDYGVNETDIMNIRLQGMDFDKLATEASSVPGVVSVGGLSHALGTWADRSDDYKRNLGDEPFTMRDFIVDANYIRNIELTFLAGKNLSDLSDGGPEREVILNETALPLFQFKDPISAVGESIYVADSTLLVVVGVVKDFNFRPLSYQIGPLALRSFKSGYDWLSMKITPGQKDAVAAIMADKWKKLDPIHVFEMRMMDEQIDDAYTRAGFRDILTIVGYVCFLAITLACLGMIGMSMYATQIRFKEVGIRKVLGATSSQITILLSRSFLFLVGIAVLLGGPLGYWLGSLFLSMYAYKIDISASILLGGTGLIVVLGLVAIGSQTWKAAEANPVKSLKYE
jgi:putative ABC transport system permease protein